MIPTNLKFWHSIELPNGEITQGAKPLSFMQFEELEVLKHVTFGGKSVLDVGAWDGYFSFAAERNGAKYVVASDWHCWFGPSWGSKNSFDFVKNSLNSSVQEWVCKAEELPTNGPKFDIVLLLGVTYHVKNPIALIERVSNLATERVVIETEYKADDNSDPLLYLIPDNSLNGDGSNWNVPNLAGVKAIMEMANLTDIQISFHPEAPTNRIFASGSPSYTN